MEHLPDINIWAIPHNEQRYPTVGDYYKNEIDIWEILVSRTNADQEFMIAVHELIEWYLTQKRGISEESITEFDTNAGKDSDDPGSMRSAPYHKEHMFATKIEKMLCKELKCSWDEYDNSLKKLKWHPKK